MYSVEYQLSETINLDDFYYCYCEPLLGRYTCKMLPFMICSVFVTGAFKPTL